MIEPMDKEEGGEGFIYSNVNRCSLFGKIQDISLVNINLEGEVRREY